ncbi:hypothetical protein V2J09_015646 [Rumex salicifolius]
MASRKLVRDFVLSKQPLWRQVTSYQLDTNARLRLVRPNAYTINRQLSVFNEFSKKIKGEATSNKEFQQTVKQLKEKTEELKGVKEDLKARTKQTTEQLYKSVDGVWTEAEATAKRVSVNMKEKLSAATEEVKGSFGVGKQEASRSSDSSANSGTGTKSENNTTSGEANQQPGPSDETLFGKLKYGFSSATPKVSTAFQKLKEAKVVDYAKMGYEIVKDELSSKPKRRKPMHYADPSSTVETSDRTEVVIVPSKQSRWSKLWGDLKDKARGNPMLKRVTKISEPVVTKGQELAEDLQERWETSDSPVVHKIQDLNDKVFGENATALSFKEIRRRDPSFSLPDFVAEVQEVIKPVLKAYSKGDDKTLTKYCSREVIERCLAEHKAYEIQGIFFDNKILHVSEVDVRETKMMGSTPIIILEFRTQQVYCVRDRQGTITDGSQDTIQTVIFFWAMQQMEPEDIGEDAIYSMWRLREMQQFGIRALI